MKARLGLLLTTILSCFILYSCVTNSRRRYSEQRHNLWMSPSIGGDSQRNASLALSIRSQDSLDIDRNYGNKRVLTDFPLEHDGSKWTGTINKLIVVCYTITGHAFKCEDCFSYNTFALINNLESCEQHDWTTPSKNQCVQKLMMK